ncbi:hypothetical protein Sliba_29510 [Streptomyces nigrescens]|uniref:Uncharacterized protein n=1 Tax=Streptomyces nigrescens TaxID=1920 RepID=A0A640TGH1_STRNI|nr:hypothetical protein Sliba_29510 [Streptomyces libani subsp. libani]
MPVQVAAEEAEFGAQRLGEGAGELVPGGGTGGADISGHHVVHLWKVTGPDGATVLRSTKVQPVRGRKSRPLGAWTVYATGMQ